MRAWFTRWSDAVKVVGAWIACLVLLCGIWLSSVLYFLENAREVNAVRLAANRIRIYDLESRRAEKDFILRSLSDRAFFRDGRSQYLERHQAKVASLRSEITKLGERVSQEQKARTNHLLQMLYRYEREFEELVSAYRERGFQEWGLQGTVTDALGSLRKEVWRTENRRLSSGIVTLEQAEHDFSRDRSPEKADQIAADLSAFREAIVKEMPPPASQAILDSVDRYGTAFAKLRETEERIGFNEELGLQKDLRSAIHALEPVVEEILFEAVRKDEEANRTLMVGLLATCFIMAVLLALAIFFAQTARVHNKRLVRVNQQMEEEHRKLLQAERLAAIGQMVTGLAHESRNAIQRTHACLDMLSQAVQDRPTALDLVGRIEESQDHLHLLYEQVREYASPLVVKCEPIQLDEVVLSAWQHLDLLHRNRKVQFKHDSDNTDLRCEVDGFAMGQVFRNIFENSLAACADPVGIEVRYREMRFSGKSAIQITVSDNGPGLGPEQRARIFDPFYTTKTKGTGLGMAIAKRLVEAHEGVIEVGSTAAAGAEIVVTLPRKAKRAA